MTEAWTTPEDYSPALLIDLFPATTTTPTTSLAQTRVMATHPAQDGSSRLFVFTDSPAGPSAYLIGSHTHISGDAATGYTFTLQDSAQITAAPESGCGCGSNLKNFRPFASARMTA